jgi:hypothetical protein
MGEQEGEERGRHASTASRSSLPLLLQLNVPILGPLLMFSSTEGTHGFLPKAVMIALWFLSALTTEILGLSRPVGATRVIKSKYMNVFCKETRILDNKPVYKFEKHNFRQTFNLEKINK